MPLKDILSTLTNADMRCFKRRGSCLPLFKNTNIVKVAMNANPATDTTTIIEFFLLLLHFEQVCSIALK